MENYVSDLWERARTVFSPQRKKKKYSTQSQKRVRNHKIITSLRRRR
jgi:hypothetical protein